MATYLKKNYSKKARRFGENAFGNQMVTRLRMETTAAGIMKEVSDKAAVAVAIADVIILDEMPKGFVWHNALEVISTAAGQAATVNVGFRYSDGVDDATFPQSDTAFFAALALNATSRGATVSVKEMKPLPKAAQLVVVVAGAALSSALVAQFVILGEQT
jgi:hypothetical protein